MVELVGGNGDLASAELVCKEDNATYNTLIIIYMLKSFYGITSC